MGTFGTGTSSHVLVVALALWHAFRHVPAECAMIMEMAWAIPAPNWFVSCLATVIHNTIFWPHFIGLTLPLRSSLSYYLCDVQCSIGTLISAHCIALNDTDLILFWVVKVKSNTVLRNIRYCFYSLTSNFNDYYCMSSTKYNAQIKMRCALP